MKTSGILRAFAVALSVAAVALPAAAQGVPSYAQPQGETIKGTVSHFDGQYTMYVNDSRGFVDRVSLHQGTVINPTGLTLRPGMTITIHGRPNGSQFIANEIDTPYHRSHLYAYPAYPVPVYPGPVYSYYPGYANVGVSIGGRW